VLHEKFHNPRIVREDIRWPRFDFGEYLRMEVFDRVQHVAMFSYLRTRVKPQIVKPNAEHHLWTPRSGGQLVHALVSWPSRSLAGCPLPKMSGAARAVLRNARRTGCASDYCRAIAILKRSSGEIG